MRSPQKQRRHGWLEQDDEPRWCPKCEDHHWNDDERRQCAGPPLIVRLALIVAMMFGSWYAIRLLWL